MHRHRDHGVLAPDARWRARVTVIVGPENALTVPKSSLAWRIDGDSLGVCVLTWATGVTTFLVS